MRKIIANSLPLGAIALPLLASAANMNSVLGELNRIVNFAVGFFIMIAIVIFFWGLIKYILNSGEEKAAGLQTMFYGVIAIFVMVSIWGLIAMLQSTFGVENVAPIIPRGTASPYSTF